jgi:hypothetical protein
MEMEKEKRNRIRIAQAGLELDTFYPTGYIHNEKSGYRIPTFQHLFTDERQYRTQINPKKYTKLNS